MLRTPTATRTRIATHTIAVKTIATTSTKAATTTATATSTIHTVIDISTITIEVLDGIFRQHRHDLHHLGQHLLQRAQRCLRVVAETRQPMSSGWLFWCRSGNQWKKHAPTPRLEKCFLPPEILPQAIGCSCSCLSMLSKPVPIGRGSGWKQHSKDGCGILFLRVEASTAALPWPWLLVACCRTWA